jgi:hypothetical protein
VIAILDGLDSMVSSDDVVSRTETVLVSMSKKELEAMTGRLIKEKMCSEGLSEEEVAEHSKLIKETLTNFMIAQLDDGDEEDEDEEVAEEDEDEEEANDASDGDIPEVAAFGDDAWKSAYGTVCWAKAGTKEPWWPSYILNPSYAIEGLRPRAIKNLGKQHLVAFLGYPAASGFGFVTNPAKNIKPYEGGTEEYTKQTMKAYTKKIMPEAVTAADALLAMDEEERAAWGRPKLVKKRVVKKKTTTAAGVDKSKEKKAPSAFMVFSMEQRPTVVAENPDMKFGDVAREIGTRWKALSEKEQAPYKKKAEKGKGKATGKAASGDKTDKPKQAPSPFMIFSTEQRPTVVAENPDMKFGDIAREIGTRWKALTDKEKAPYVTKNEQAKENLKNAPAAAKGGKKTGKVAVAKKVGKAGKKASSSPMKGADGELKGARKTREKLFGLSEDGEGNDADEAEDKPEEPNEKDDTEEDDDDDDYDYDADFEEAKKKAKLESANKPKAPRGPAKPKAAPPKPPPRPAMTKEEMEKKLATETRPQRAERLTKLLEHHSKLPIKVTQTIKKIDAMDLNLDEIKASGAAAAIKTCYKKHADEGVRNVAGELFNKWKNSMKAATTAPPADAAPAVAPPVPPADDEEDEAPAKKISSNGDKRKRVVGDDDEEEDEAPAKRTGMATSPPFPLFTPN